MLLRSVSFVLLTSLTVATAKLSAMSTSAENAPSRRDVMQMVPAQRSSGVARTRQFRRAFKRSLVQIFGMTKRPSRRRAASDGGGVPPYMRWLHEESSGGRLSTVLSHLGQRRSAYRQKRHSQLTANTVRSFTGRNTATISSRAILHCVKIVYSKI